MNVKLIWLYMLKFRIFLVIFHKLDENYMYRLLKAHLPFKEDREYRRFTRFIFGTFAFSFLLTLCLVVKVSKVY